MGQKAVTWEAVWQRVLEGTAIFGSNFISSVILGRQLPSYGFNFLSCKVGCSDNNSIIECQRIR